ncbi:uncharacterized protein LOC143302129 isoform X2 [Babylonia areolata]|uniref:uncharacterized protein LOC143302129 isoform X2 n=1 Tax=Babylonia areolata TaxID=304850 RepID=UPI003FD47B91
MVAPQTVRFLLAARNGNVSVLQSEKLTEAVQDDHGATCLHYAARGGAIEALEFLVNSRGFKPTRRSNVGATALHDAAASGQLDTLKWLLQQCEVKVDDQDGTGATVTQLSARYGHTQTLQWLLDETNCDVLKKSASGAVALHFAAEGGHLECVKLLIAEAPRSVNMQMNNGSTPVYLACQRGHLMTAEYLASKNGTPKIHTFDGMSPLHAAAQMGHQSVVSWLVKDQGLNPNERDFDGATPLHYAASGAHQACVDWLVREGGARIILDNLGGSPLHSAAQFGHTQIVTALLEGGCNRDITDNAGLKAEELADRCGHQHTADVIRGKVDSIPPRPTLTTSPPPKVRPPSPKHPPPPRRRPSANSCVSTQPGGVVTSASKVGAPPTPSPKPSSSIPLRAEVTGATSQQVERSVLRGATSQQVERSVLRGTTSEQVQASAHAVDGVHNVTGTVLDRSMSLASVASSASSFGYFSPHTAGQTQLVEVDIHDAPSELCVFNSQETGEREVTPCPLTARSSSSSSTRFSEEELSRASASAHLYISSSASASSQLPPVKSSFLSSRLQPDTKAVLPHDSNIDTKAVVPHGNDVNISSGSCTEQVLSVVAPVCSGSREKEATVGRCGETSSSHQRDHSPTVRERKVLLAAAAQRRQTVRGGMEKTQKTDSSMRSVGSTGSGGSARSVISISNRHVTIISTGTDGAQATPKQSTPQLHTDARLSGGGGTPKQSTPQLHTDARLSGGGGTPKQSTAALHKEPLVSHAPSSSPLHNTNLIAALTHKFQGGEGAMASSPTSGIRGAKSVITAPQGLVPLKPWQQAQQLQLQKRQQMPETTTTTTPPPPPPPVGLMNGHIGTSSHQNGHTGMSSHQNGHDFSGGVPSPPPPPPPLSQSGSQQTAVRKAEAYYTPRTKPMSSTPGTPRGGDLIDQQKTDLMSALNALVTTGSPSASLRKTSGPGKGGVKEVFSSRKTPGGAVGSGSSKQSPLPSIAEFDPKNFLQQVEDVDSTGNKIPDWKRQLRAKNLALKAQHDYIEQRKIEEYEARFKDMPAWKRALIEKKEAAGRAGQ